MIESEFSGKSEYCFLLAHDFLLDPAKAVAYTVYKSMKGAGTRDKSLINATVLFRDRYVISSVYAKFGNLAADIKGDTSGNYEKSLLAFWKVQ